MNGHEMEPLLSVRHPVRTNAQTSLSFCSVLSRRNHFGPIDSPEEPGGVRRRSAGQIRRAQGLPLRGSQTFQPGPLRPGPRGHQLRAALLGSGGGAQDGLDARRGPHFGSPQGRDQAEPRGRLLVPVAEERRGEGARRDPPAPDAAVPSRQSGNLPGLRGGPALFLRREGAAASLHFHG